MGEFSPHMTLEVSWPQTLPRYDLELLRIRRSDRSAKNEASIHLQVIKRLSWTLLGKLSKSIVMKFHHLFC